MSWAFFMYTHVTRKDLQQIKSPLDNAMEKLYLRDMSNKSYYITSCASFKKTVKQRNNLKEINIKYGDF